MRLEDMSFGVVFSGAFAIVICFVVAVAGTGYWGMSKMDGALRQIQNENNLKIKLSHIVFDTLNTSTWLIRLIPYKAGNEAVQGMEKQVYEYRNAYSTSMEALGKMKNSAEEKAVIDDITSIAAEAFKSGGNIMELAKLGKQEEALVLVKAQLDPLTHYCPVNFECTRITS